MILFAGLGNPGKRYQNHRHNIGFKMLDKIIEHFELSARWQKKFQGEIFQTNLPGFNKKLIFFKPQSYMNCSGAPLAACVNFYKIALDDLFVFHDELALPVGKVRVRKNGGSGGHNGIRSIDRQLGNAYWRVRIGIDHPGTADQVPNYVLENFSKDEIPKIEQILTRSAQHLSLLLEKKIDSFMNKIILEK